MNNKFTFVNREESNHEVVRKFGLGNRFTLCDGLAEFILINFQEAYLRDYGEEQPCEVPLLYIKGGKTEPTFNGGEISKPSTIYATCVGAPYSNDPEELITDSIIEYINLFTPNFDDNNIKPIFIEGGEKPDKANIYKFKRNLFDIGGGYASNSICEQLINVLDDKFFIGSQVKNSPISNDIEFLCIRDKNTLDVNIQCSLYDSCISNQYELDFLNSQMQEAAYECCNKFLDYYPTSYELNIKFNNNTNNLTIMGTTAESKDSIVNAGNGINELLNYSFPTQYVYGKDNLYSVSKNYSRLGTEICEKIVEKYEVKDAQMYLLTDYGNPLFKPKSSNIVVNGDFNKDLAEEAKDILLESNIQVN